jgi:hypothetical protein
MRRIGAGEEKGAVAATVAFYSSAARWGQSMGVAPCGRRGSRERGRGRGGCPTQTDGRRPIDSSPRLAGTGGMAQPCRAAGPNMGGGGRLTGVPRPQCRAAAPADRRARAAQCRVQTNSK